MKSECCKQQQKRRNRGVRVSSLIFQNLSIRVYLQIISKALLSTIGLPWQNTVPAASLTDVPYSLALAVHTKKLLQSLIMDNVYLCTGFVLIKVSRQLQIANDQFIFQHGQLTILADKAGIYYFVLSTSSCSTDENCGCIHPKPRHNPWKPLKVLSLLWTQLGT